MYKKNSINKIKKQHHTHKRTKKRSYGKPSNKKNTKHNKRTQKYGYYNKNNKITKKRVYNKKKKVLVGGASGAAVVVPKIMICTKNFYKYLIPVLNYLQNQNKFLDNTIDVIYANGKNSESLLNQSIKLKSITDGKIKSIFNEAFIMMTTPFIIYIDDDNEIIKSKETQIPEQFGMYLYKYKVENSGYDLNEEPGINIDNDNYEETINKNSGYKCLCIHLPYETTSICADIYYNLIKDILLFIKQKFHNYLLTVFDFDNTLTQLHLFKSIVKNYDQYTDEKKKEFVAAFLNPLDDNNGLKEAEINKYFGEGNIQKILKLFEIIKSSSLPIAPKAQSPSLEAERARLEAQKAAKQTMKPLKLIRAEQSMWGKTQNFFSSLKKTIASPTPKAPSIKEQNQRLAKLQTNLEAHNKQLQQRALNAKAKKDAQITKLLESQTSNNAQIEQQIAQKKAETDQRLATIKAEEAEITKQFLNQITNTNQAEIKTEIEDLNAQTEKLRNIIVKEEAERARIETNLLNAEGKSHNLNHERMAQLQQIKQEELTQIKQKGIIAKEKLSVNYAHIKVLELLNTVYEQMSNLNQPNNTENLNQIKEWNTQIKSSQELITNFKSSVKNFQTKAQSLVNILTKANLETEKAEAEETLQEANNYMNMVTGYEQKLQSNKTTINQSLPLAKSIRTEEERRTQEEEERLENEQTKEQVKAAAQHQAILAKQEAEKAEQSVDDEMSLIRGIEDIKNKNNNTREQWRTKITNWHAKIKEWVTASQEWLTQVQNLVKIESTDETQRQLTEAQGMVERAKETFVLANKQLNLTYIENIKTKVLKASNNTFEIYTEIQTLFNNPIEGKTLKNNNNIEQLYINKNTGIKKQIDTLKENAEESLKLAKKWHKLVKNTTMDEDKKEAQYYFEKANKLMTLLQNFSKEINTELKNPSNIKKTKKKSSVSTSNNSTKTKKSLGNKVTTFFSRLKNFFDKNKDGYEPLINVNNENETGNGNLTPNSQNFNNPAFGMKTETKTSNTLVQTQQLTTKQIKIDLVNQTSMYNTKSNKKKLLYKLECINNAVQIASPTQPDFTSYYGNEYNKNLELIYDTIFLYNTILITNTDTNIEQQKENLKILDKSKKFINLLNEIEDLYNDKTSLGMDFFTTNDAKLIGLFELFYVVIQLQDNFKVDMDKLEERKIKNLQGYPNQIQIISFKQESQASPTRSSSTSSTNPFAAPPPSPATATISTPVSVSAPVPPPFAASTQVLNPSSSSVSNPASTTISSSVTAPDTSSSSPSFSSSSSSSSSATTPAPAPILTPPTTPQLSPAPVPTKHLSELTKMLWRLEGHIK